MEGDAHVSRYLDSASQSDTGRLICKMEPFGFIARRHIPLNRNPTLAAFTLAVTSGVDSQTNATDAGQKGFALLSFDDQITVCEGDYRQVILLVKKRLVADVS